MEIIAKRLNLIYDRCNQVACGIYNDYHVLFSPDMAVKEGCILIISAKPPEGQDESAFNQKIATLAQEIPAILQCCYEQPVLKITFSAAGLFAHPAYCVASKVTTLLQELGYLDCCAYCANEEIAGLYRSNDRFMWLCPKCTGLKQSDVAEPESNMLLGIVGAAAGSVIGIILWTIMSWLGLLASPAGLILALLAFKGYQRLGGNMSKTDIMICCSIIFVISIVGQFLVLGLVGSIQAGDLSMFKSVLWEVIIGFSTQEVFRTQVLGEYVMSLLFMGLGSLSCIRKICRQANNVDTVCKVI